MENPKSDLESCSKPIKMPGVVLDGVGLAEALGLEVNPEADVWLKTALENIREAERIDPVEYFRRIGFVAL